MPSRINWEKGTAAKVLKILAEARVDDEWVTIIQTAKKLGVAHPVARYYFNYLERNRQIAHRGDNPRYYQLADTIYEIPIETAPDGLAQAHFDRLKVLAMQLRTGLTDDNDVIGIEKSSLEHSIKMYKKELEALEAMYACPDLWEVRTLVNRLGFEDESPD